MSRSSEYLTDEERLVRWMRRRILRGGVPTVAAAADAMRMRREEVIELALRADLGIDRGLAFTTSPGRYQLYERE